MFQQVGGSFGTAVVAAVMASAYGFSFSFLIIVLAAIVGAAAALTMPRKHTSHR